ncbi:hypothetical protein Hanom_Chr16g01482181 [Helianthus anomalus]
MNKKRDNIAIINPLRDSILIDLIRGMYLPMRSQTLYIAIRTRGTRIKMRAT